ncbi:MAG: outer membrane lipid asymmetry maintenance protein MlaD [Alphaproteobacteria bacterium]|nr:outer membrane lipid asymmetry maintenance protein MlaD [Alphaproteobacteria bacterium]
MGSQLVETLIGAVVLAVAALFFGFAYTSTKVGRVSGYELTARFDKVDGLRIGSDVRMAGIKIGTVTGQRVDAESYQAEIKLSVDPAIKLPDDSTAKIASDGLLGSKFLALEAGASDRTLSAGGRIKFTQGSINLEELLGKFVFSSTDQGAKPAK